VRRRAEFRAVEVFRALVSASSLNFYDYVNHAVQTDEAKAAIDDLVRKRKVLTIAGYKG